MSADRSLQFAPHHQDPFSTELSSEIRNYFSSRKLSMHANGHMLGKSIFYLGAFFALYFTLLLGSPGPWLALGLCVLLGLTATGIGFNIGHDAIHTAYSSSSRINRLFSHSYSLLGANVHNWKVLHNVIHHSYTNIAHADGDLETVKWLRFYQRNEDLKGFHRFQHWYAPFFYSLTSLVWVFKKDFDHILKTRHMLYEKPALPKGELASLIMLKALYLTAFLIVPVVVGGYSVGQTLLGFLVLHVCCGLSLALTFQLGHIVEGPSITKLELGENALASWHRMQLQGTANFAPRNPIINFFCGGLNYQIEHHLFPKICHVHYPKLSPIVQAVAARHGLPYHQFPTLRGALRSHFCVLKKAGRPALDIPRTLGEAITPAPVKTTEAPNTLAESIEARV